MGGQTDNKPYVPRGLVIDRLARKKQVRGTSAISRFMKQKARQLGYDPDIARSKSTIGNYLYGNTAPDEDWLTLFAIAFELTDEEMGELAFSHSFRVPTAA
jgi:hypothetical protein